MSDMLEIQARAKARAAIQSRFGQAEPAPEPTFGSRANEAFSGVNTGIANVLGLASEIGSASVRALTPPPIKKGMDALGVPDILPKPGTAGASIRRGMTRIGIPDVQPVDRTGRVIKRIGEEVGAASVPMAGLGARATSLAKEGKKVLTGAEEFFVKPFMKKPKQAVATETALATGAGAGAGLAKEYLGDSPTTDVGGAVTGSLATGGLMSIGRMVGGAAKAAMTPERTASRFVRGDVGEALSKNTVDADVAFGSNLKESKNLESAIPNMKMTTGEATRDPGLQSLEYSRRSAGPHVGDFQQRRTANNQSINRALDAEAPAAQTDEATRGELERRREKAVGTAQNIEGAKGRQAERAVEAIDPDMSAQEAGREVRGTLARGKQTMADFRDAEALPLLKQAEDNGAQVDTAPVADLIDQKLAVDKRDSVRGALTRARGKLNVAGSDDLDSSVSGLYEARKAINDMIAGKGENAADRYAKKELMDVRNALDAQINKAAPEFGDYLKRYREGSLAVDPYKAGATRQVLDSDIGGRPSVPDSEVVGQFFRAGSASKEAIQEFEINAGGNKAAVKALRAYAIDDALRNAATPDGTVSVKALENWIKKHRDALDAYPEIRADLGDVARAQKSLERTSKRANMLESSLADPKKSTIAKYLDRETAKDSMQAILSSTNQRKEMTNLVQTVRRDPDALEGAKRGMWDLMMEGSTKSPRAGIKSAAEDAAGTPLLKPAVFKEFMKKHGDAMRILYKDDQAHLGRLERIVDAVAAGQRTTNIKPAGTSGTALAARDVSVPGLTVAGLVSRGYGYARGVVSLPYLVLETGGRAARRAYLNMKADRVSELLDRALLDPDLAKTLVMEYRDGTQNIVAKRLRTHLGNEAAVWVSDEPSDESQRQKNPMRPQTP